jgi:cytoskeletal protein CcmA (bactofilin family)
VNSQPTLQWEKKRMPFNKKSQRPDDQLTVSQETSEPWAFALQLRSSATRSRELATTATRSVIDAITPQLHSSATRSRELATTATRSVIEAVTRRATIKSRKSGTPRSVIDAWLIMSGNIQSDGEIKIDGKVKGDIRCKQLIVGQDATIIGDIAAEVIVVRGCVKGTIRANCITLRSTARVKGEIFYKLFAVEGGAAFDGQFYRSAEPLKASGKPEKWVTELQAMSSAMTVLDKPNGESIEPKTVSAA